MKKIIRKQIILIACAAVFLVGVVGLVINYNLLKERFFSELKTEINMVKLLDESGFEALASYDQTRITIIDANSGNVTFDNQKNIAEMDNHFDREEVVLALKDGEGQSFRFSKTLDSQTFYYAILIDNHILRLSKTTNVLVGMVLTYLAFISLSSIIIVFICIFFAGYVTDIIIRPINKLTDNVNNIENEIVYDELLPFVKTIQNQHVDILKAANLRQEFAANVSHELKTPLTVISGYSELMANGIVNEEDTIKLAKDIYNSATALSKMVEDIINLSSLDYSNLSLNITNYNLKDQIKEIISKMRIIALKREVTIESDLNDCFVNLDYNLINELLQNLIVNAINYNKVNGKVYVSCYQENGSSYVIVKDTGIGIKERDQKRVFERFYRVDKSRSKKTGGTGLGLSIVKHILSQFSASIDLQSTYGKGTTIKITF